LKGKPLRKKAQKTLSKKPKASPKIQVWAREKTRRSDREFRAIFELSSVGMTERDAATGLRIRVNQRLCEMTGYSAKELLKEKGVTLTHPDDRERNREVRAVVLKGESDTWVIEKRYVRKNGEVIWVHVNGNLIRDSSGQPYRTVAVIQDITERKQAEERELKEHEETSLVNRILRLFVEHDGDELFDRALAVVQEGMASKHGVFGYITEPGHLFCPSLSKMLDECEIEGKCIHYPPEKWRGLWARAMTEKRSFYTNEAPPVPPGHPIIHNNLAVPILFQGGTIGLLNLANKEDGYSEEDRKMLDAIAARMAPVLYAWIHRKLRDDERGQAEEALTKAKDELEMRVRERTEELAESQERLRHLASQFLIAQEQERKRVAIELHDGLLSELAATKYLLEGKIMLLEKGKLADPAEFIRVSDMLATVMKEARRILNNLHPSVLDELGLIAAINWFSGEYEKSYPHIKVQKQFEVSEADISDSIRVVIFRVLQEALNNFAKHGKGDRVDLSLSKSDSKFALLIQDNGQGFIVAKAQRGLGLESMRERVELSGGEFQIESIIGQGTTIRAMWGFQ